MRIIGFSLCVVLFLTCKLLMAQAIVEEVTTSPAAESFAVSEAAIRDSGLDRQRRLSQQVTIYRDEWGSPHIHGVTHESTIFGMGYAQAEDYFWQVEDNCIRALGRYSEIAGEASLQADTLNRVFQIPSRSKADFAKLKPQYQRMIAGFTDGVNYYLATHPEVKPRLITRFEPWHVVAMDRFLILDFVYGKAHAGRPKPDSFEAAAQAAVGSNQWAIGPDKTRSRSAMLFINPHQPWFGPAQFTESHIISDEGINFSGASFYGNPIPALGFNGSLGWAYTVNEPDIADVYRVHFNESRKDAVKLTYQHGDEKKVAESWEDTIQVKTTEGLDSRTFRFFKTHHGPIVRFEDDTTGLSVRIAGLFDRARVDQAYEMIQAENFEQWYQAMRHCAIPMFNVAYADRDQNIFYAYNGSIPRRREGFDWLKPVDGNNPDTDWLGLFAFDDLPQVLNPSSGYVQNCNTSPFFTTDEDNPDRGDFPAYMMEDRDEDKRRAKMSRRILRATNDLTFDKLQELVFDSTLYWPLSELPRFRRDFERLKTLDPARAEKVRPYFEHLLDWDCKVTADSTQATLCEAWYIELYGEGYPAETIRSRYATDRTTRLDALVKAADGLKQLHGQWKIPWAKIHRIQRVTKRPGVVEAAVAFNDFGESVQNLGAPGPLGIIFTMYSTPSIRWVRPKRYAVVGACYMAAVEFAADGVKATSLIPYGKSADRKSPHYMDQARLMADKKLKTAWYTLDDVRKHAKRSYHPGEKAE